MTTEVIWEPHPGSQTLFITCPYDEVLYHGTRGPGKTDALIMDFAQFTGQGFGVHWRGILFRESYVQLEDVIAKTKKWFPRIWPEATYTGSSHTWTWPDGEQLLLRYMSKPEDYWNYHGHAYPWQGWEELTNWPTSDCYDSMKACLRSSQAGIPKRLRSTCNPWGAGHHWVKNHFIDAGRQGQPIFYRQKHPLTGEIIERSKTHVYGSIFENIHLMQSDPEYLINLVSIKDPNKRAAWLKGSWDISAGGYFGDVWEASRNVIQHPFTPPKTWPCFTAFDWGSASPFSVGFWATADGTEAPDGNFYPAGALVRFDEWYGCKKGEANKGLYLQNPAIGAGIAERIKAYAGRGLKFEDGVADPSIYKEDGGPSIYNQILAGAKPVHRVGQLWEKAANQRIPGWQKMRDLIAGKDDPMFYVMANNLEFLRTVPVLPRDERNWDDVDTDAEDHIADEVRYACMRKKRFLKVQKLSGL